MLQLLIREVNQDDSPFLWEMLFHAAHMVEEGATAPDAAKNNPFLNQYVAEWGKDGDLGFIALDEISEQKVGAVWVRLLNHDKNSASYQDDTTPELAIAVDPRWLNCGIGGALLVKLIEEARLRYPAIVLTVRENNPAVRLYQRYGFEIINELINRVGTKSYKMLLKFN